MALSMVSNQVQMKAGSDFLSEILSIHLLIRLQW